MALERRNRAIRAIAWLRVCDDSPGGLVAAVSQRHRLAKRLFAHSRFLRDLPATPGGCRRYLVRWRIPDKLLGKGLYAVEMRVRDANGAWSNRVGLVRSGTLYDPSRRTRR
jgi:hypothetical protein